MIKNEKAPLVTTPKLKPYTMKYNATFIIGKAKGKWPEIFDALGIFLQNSFCPLCEAKETFEIKDISTAEFLCTHCQIKGGGIDLLQQYHAWDYEEAVERIGRFLKIRHSEVCYG